MAHFFELSLTLTTIVLSLASLMRHGQHFLPSSRSSRVIVVNERIQRELTWMYYATSGNDDWISK